MPKTASFSDLCKPTDRQAEFFRATDNHKYVLYGGAAGGGKSYALRWALLRFLLRCFSQGHTGVVVGMFCETFPEVYGRQVNDFLREIPPWLGEFKKSKSQFHLKPEFGGGQIWFLNLDKPEKYRSYQFAAIAVDELTLNSFQTFVDLSFRLRWPGIETPRFFAGTNPGGIGHAWVKRFWIDRNFDGTEYDPDDFMFVPARISDNPYLPASYQKTLNELPEEMRKAVRDGDWTMFQGRFFPEFDASKHVIDPIYLPSEWERGLAVDYGYSDPWCVLWGAKEPETGRIYVYRELYKTQVKEDDQAQTLILAGAAEKRKFAVGDPSMFSASSGDSAASIYLQHGISLIPANNDRIHGWQTIRRALSPLPDGAPGLQIFNTCTNLVRTLPNLLYSKRIAEDCEFNHVEDHAPDTLRYLCTAFNAFTPVQDLEEDEVTATFKNRWKRPQFARRYNW